MIDTHIHLAHEKYQEDLEDVVASAKANGVEEVVLIGCDEVSIPDAIRLWEADQEFYNLAIGWHPVDVRDFNEKNKAMMLEAIEKYPVVAIGEIGLDYYWYPEEKAAQIELFEWQVKLSKEKDLPIIIHAREAYDDCYEILSKYAPIKGVMHSYADIGENVERFLNLGMYIGLSGPITFKNGQNQKETAKVVPLNRLLLETDGPYLTPVPYRGKRNRPEYIEYIAEEIALQKQVSKEEVIKQTTINAHQLFGGKSNV